jgi:very-short-patch-repair endonuclease
MLVNNWSKISDAFTGGVPESPIERILQGHLLRFGMRAICQYPIGPYRADLYYESDCGNKIVIECDGAEFHTGGERDAKRDDYMRRRGYTVLRFAGTEIYNRPVKCAMRVIEEIPEIYQGEEYQDFEYRFNRQLPSRHSDLDELL